MASEYLHRLHQITVSKETLRRWMAKAGLWRAGLVRVVDVFAAYGIGKFLEARGDLIEHLPLAGWRNDPSIFAAFEVDVDPVEADGVGHAAGPIDMGEEFGVARIGGIVESEEALLHEEGVEVHGAVEAREAVVADDHEAGIGAGLLHGFADGGIL